MERESFMVIDFADTRDVNGSVDAAVEELCRDYCHFRMTVPSIPVRKVIVPSPMTSAQSARLAEAVPAELWEARPYIGAGAATRAVRSFVCKDVAGVKDPVRFTEFLDNP